MRSGMDAFFGNGDDQLLVVNRQRLGDFEVVVFAILIHEAVSFSPGVMFILFKVLVFGDGDDKLFVID